MGKGDRSQRAEVLTLLVSVVRYSHLAPTMISSDLLTLLRCPITGQTLTQADAEALKRLNADREKGSEIKDALIRADGKAAFPIEDGIPLLLRESILQL